MSAFIILECHKYVEVLDLFFMLGLAQTLKDLPVLQTPA